VVRWDSVIDILSSSMWTTFQASVQYCWRRQTPRASGFIESGDFVERTHKSTPMRQEKRLSIAAVFQPNNAARAQDEHLMWNTSKVATLGRLSGNDEHLQK
jgi:hypothetical protein